MFLQRSNSAELMDDFTIQDTRIDQALKELKVINKFLGGNAGTRYGIKKILEEKHIKDLDILDLGGGASDILKSLTPRWSLNIFNVDLNYRVCCYTKSSFSDVECICANAVHPPFKTSSFDIINASLFMHHFSDSDIKKMITVYLDISKLAVIINDLRRSVFALLGIRLLTILFSKSVMVKNDAPLSVRRGFIKSELVKILAAAGIRNYTIRRKWAFRWIIIIPKQ